MGKMGVRRTKADGRCMMEDVVARLKELTDVDFERDSAKCENEFSSLRSLLSQFIENEMRSCSMDYGCITPEYVQRAWGGRVAIEDIEAAFEKLKRNNDLLFIGK